MSRQSWLAGRVALAIALMIAFYVLAVAVSTGLLWLAYIDLTRTRHPNGRLILFCVIGAGSVLWAILPRRDRFEAPGPELTADEQPELFALIEDVAAATSQAMPAEVYLTNDVNAFVTQRDGLMGVGGKRIMALGLPLMQALSVDEFKGVLTHEFGHYHAGDVALGPWIHKTQAAIGRTIVQLSQNVLRFIFIGFANLFLRVTHAVSRRQEFIADELAAGVVGGETMASGLRKVNVAAVAYQAYWFGELQPVIKAGYRPPVSDGFGRYTASPRLSSLFDSIAVQQEQASVSDPYDTHPSLAERVAALQRQRSVAPRDRRPATALLRDVVGCEGRVFQSLSADFAALKPLDWTRVADEVYFPAWRARVRQHGALLHGFTVGEPPRTTRELQRIGAAMTAATLDDAARANLAWELIIAAFALALHSVGWTAEVLPGDEVLLRKGTDVVRPYSELQALIAGTATLDEWQQRCAVLGIAALPLAPQNAVTGSAVSV